MAGYIGPAPVPQATQNREAFTATSGQTSFATAGYTPQFIDVYLNGVKLAAADYTATNGSDVVLASGAASGDILEVVAFSAFTVADQAFTGTTTAANLTVTGAFTSQGIDDNADAVAITIDSSENVGIGTSSPAALLHLSGTSEVIRIEDTDATLAANQTIGKLEFYSNDASGAGVGVKASVKALAEDTIGRTSLVFSTADSSSNDTEAMRLDASGNLLVGTTTQLNSARATFDQGFGAAATFNRRSSDGAIAYFAKDGSTVGSIGVNNLAYPYLVNPTSGGGGIACGTGAAIVPVDASGAFTNNSKDIGTSSVRFKDLYLSGKIAASNSSSLQFGSTSCAIEGTSSGADYIKITTNSSEAMRIDSSGNLLVGKTSDNFSVEGFAVRQSASSGAANLTVTRDSNHPLALNRTTDNGDIVKFYKDGSTVGGIGVNSGTRIYIGSGDANLTFNPVGNYVFPSTSTGGARDAQLDLGLSAARFKDLYLSGGAYLGGTGSSNKLDDYESGTWTPVYDSTWSEDSWDDATGLAIGYADYTKVGNAVTLFGSIKITGQTAGNLVTTSNVTIAGLPFNINTVSTSGFNAQRGSGTFHVYTSIGSGFFGTGSIIGYTNKLIFTVTAVSASGVGNNSEVFFTYTYEAA